MKAKIFSICLTLLCAQGLAYADDVTENMREKLGNRVLKSSSSDLERKQIESRVELNNNLLETHTVTTEDGYILTLNRMAGPPGSVPVLLQHGLLGCAEEWLIAGAGKSLPHILNYQGYDVWLGNIRGSTLSRKHQTLSTSDPQFWNFTWVELGLYDLPAMITYITQLKNDSLFYVGHSMGATTFSVMSIEKPEIAKNVKAMLSLAPATYVYHMKSPPMKLMSYFWNAFLKVSHTLGFHEFFPRNVFFDSFSYYICESRLLRGIFCSNSLFLISGFNSKQLDFDLLPKIWSLFPAGTSIKLYTHFLQQVTVNELRKFDYGAENNLLMYNSSVPPNYDISQIRVPVAVFWSENDWTVVKEDVYHFYEQLSFKLGIYKVEDSLFNHFDFLWGMNAPETLYANMLNVMNDYEKKKIDFVHLVKF
ncbi:lipase 3-like [Copidosoma floridanum]|uniref:lipase 3-like n=1 Tax=Copidosoma floridanum TaxID=29053 RepID=UPI0006C9BB1D|nr:lipase 3-like [Copidosoma floridanum]